MSVIRGQVLFRRPSILLALSTIRVTCKSHDRLLGMVTPRSFKRKTVKNRRDPFWRVIWTYKLDLNNRHALQYSWPTYFRMLHLQRTWQNVFKTCASPVFHVQNHSGAAVKTWQVHALNVNWFTYCCVKKHDSLFRQRRTMRKKLAVHGSSKMVVRNTLYKCSKKFSLNILLMKITNYIYRLLRTDDISNKSPQSNKELTYY